MSGAFGDSAVWLTTAGGLLPLQTFIPECVVHEAFKSRSGGRGFEENRHPRDRDGKWTRKGMGQRGGDEQKLNPNVMPGKLVKTGSKAWDGRPTKVQLQKWQTGAIGEAVALRYLRSAGARDAGPLNTKRNNFPVDAAHDHEMVEIKTGLASSKTPRWRATIGEPGQKEKALLRRLGPQAKAAWNARKKREIMTRKARALSAASRATGKTYKARTIAMILNPDRRTVDIYSFPGFHAEIRWTSDKAKSGFVGSYRY